MLEAVNISCLFLFVILEQSEGLRAWSGPRQNFLRSVVKPVEPRGVCDGARSVRASRSVWPTAEVDSKDF